MSNSDLLSQDEIDALLSGVDSGDVETEAEEALEPGELQAYDFASQDRIVRGRMPTLEMINERFARNLRISLFNLLRRSPAITAEGVQMSKFGEYVQTLLMPSNLNIVKVKPLRGAGLVVLNPKLVFSLVDCFFGGEGRFPTKVEGREFTATEMRIVERVLQMCFDDLKAAWEPILPVEFEYVNAEINPQFANIVSPGEVVVVSSFHIDLDAGSGYLHITLPYSMLEPIRETLDAGVQSDVKDQDARWQVRLREEITTATVELESTLATKEIALRDVLNFQTGSVINLELPEAVSAVVGGVPVFRAEYGVSRGNMALKVTEPVKHEEIVPAPRANGARP
ncbi:MAG: flagellar motor switch protein FliM [Gammaproteobacteria bacterium]|nr:flagellar motor switch protein FliM [Gammaproteobacteria bacterium]